MKGPNVRGQIIQWIQQDVRNVVQNKNNTALY